MPLPPDRSGLRRGRFCRLVMASALAAGGCESWKTARNDHPVLGPPPPRLSWADAPAEGVEVADASGDGGVVRVSLSQPGPLTDYSLVAIVNGEPIVAGEILAPYEVYFVRAVAKGAPEREIEAAKNDLIRKHLDHRIDETLLVQSLKLMLKPEQWKQTEEKLDQAWKAENEKIMAKNGVNSRLELEKQLAAGGASLSEFEQSFKKQQLAMLYLSYKTGDFKPVFSRQDYLNYYDSHAEKYEHPAQARFRLLMVSRTGGDEKARAKLDQALAELRQGTPFPDVVERHSDHPTAKKGGLHDWFKPGDFNVKEVDRALFELPVGEVSGVFEAKKPPAFMVVQVTERQPAGRTPFAEVYEEIGKTLETEFRRAKVDELMAKLREGAVVTRYVD